MWQIQDFQGKPVQQINYTAYDARSKKSKKPSIKQNSSSTGSTGSSKRQCFQCGEPYSRKHLEECKAKNIKCNGCGITGHLQKCCKKSGNFPKDNSNQQNQSSSTGPGHMNIAAAVPVDFFDEKGLLKDYRPPPVQQQIGHMNILRKVPSPSKIQHNISTSVSDTVPDPVPPPEFPFQEFLPMEVVTQSQVDSYIISDRIDLRENNNSSRNASKSTDFPLKLMQSSGSYEEIPVFRDLTVSAKHTQSSRDSSTISISENSTTGNSTPGIQNGISFEKEGEIQEIQQEMHSETQLSNKRSVMPTDVQVLTVLQDLLSDDFKVKNTDSLQRKGEDEKDEVFQLIQKLHNQLQQVQWDLQRLHSLHKYKI